MDKCPEEKYSWSSVVEEALLKTLPVSTPGTRVVLNIRSYWDEHMGIVCRSMSCKAKGESQTQRDDQLIH